MGMSQFNPLFRQVKMGRAGPSCPFDNFKFSLQASSVVSYGFSNPIHPKNPKNIDPRLSGTANFLVARSALRLWSPRAARWCHRQGRCLHRCQAAECHQVQWRRYYKHFILSLTMSILIHFCFGGSYGSWFEIFLPLVSEMMLGFIYWWLRGLQIG